MNQNTNICSQREAFGMFHAWQWSFHSVQTSLMHWRYYRLPLILIHYTCWYIVSGWQSVRQGSWVENAKSSFINCLATSILPYEITWTMFVLKMEKRNWRMENGALTTYPSLVVTIACSLASDGLQEFRRIRERSRITEWDWNKHVFGNGDWYLIHGCACAEIAGSVFAG